MNTLARILIGAGALLVLGGLMVWGLNALLPGVGLGRLPGDIRIERPGFTLYVPFTSSILVSILLSLLLYVLTWWR